MWLEVTQLFFISYLCNVIYCTKVYKLNANELQQNLLNNDYDENDNLKGLNRVLVKRIVPHGSESQGLEYNKKLNYLYRPLARFHIQKPLIDVLISEENQQAKKIFKRHKLKDFEYNDLDQKSQRVNDGRNTELKIYKLVNLNRDGVNELLKLIGGENDKSDDRKFKKYRNYERHSERYKKRKSDDVKLLLKLLNKDENYDLYKYSKFKKLARELLDARYGEETKSKQEFWDKVEKRLEKMNNKKDFYNNLVNTFTQVLRYGDDEKPPQGNESISAVKKEDAASATEKPKMPLPFYPYWNWWTYKQNLYHDNCRNGWVRFHNMCYELPPH